MIISMDRPSTPDVLALLEQHLTDMYVVTPAESVHALDPDELADLSITFWSARDERSGELLGIGALKQHDASLGEVKSMRTAPAARGRGVASAVLTVIIEECRARGIAQLKLETGIEDYFAPARALYVKHGFVVTEPFAAYTDDPNSAYFALTLRKGDQVLGVAFVS